MQRGQGAGGDDLEIGGDKIGIRSGETQACPSGGMTSLATGCGYGSFGWFFLQKGEFKSIRPRAGPGSRMCPGYASRDLDSVEICRTREIPEGLHPIFVPRLIHGRCLEMRDFIRF